ncbi:MAG: pyruvate phosphate dikinase, partial [Planctomycetes bacterium]|nr:pyruvate phosphate dikinase [Planctomycetota bacterium]
MAHSMFEQSLSTGLPGLDEVIRGLMVGDNLVWQVNNIEDYRPFVEPAYINAVRRRQTVVYFRFANKHRPLLEASEGLEIVEVHPEDGFDAFIKNIHTVINRNRHRALYIFDCLSELVVDWCSDRMLGNFFMLTCPHLYDVGAIAYFALLRDHHSIHATRPISETTQILIDVYRYQENIYIHPIKVQHRHSSTMYDLHAWRGEVFQPVHESYTITEIKGKSPWSNLDAANYRHGFWSNTFAAAEDIQADLERGRPAPPDLDKFIDQLLRMMISRDERI